MSQPNILLFIMDGLQAPLLDPAHVCKTPNFDRISRRGLRFENAYTPAPTCSPARASLMTGLLPHNHGVLQVEHAVDDDQCVLRTDKPHWAQRLQAANYTTGYFGKWHIERTDQLQQFGWTQAEVLGRATHRNHSQKGGPTETPLDPKLTRYQEGPDGYNPILHYGVTDVPGSERMGQTAQKALNFLDQQRGSGQPWCCVASYYEPNEAMVVSREAFEQYDLSSIELPKNLKDDLGDRPNFYRRQQQIFDNVTDDEWRNALACYYGRVTELDEQFGRLLDRLEESGELDNTVVIVTADHGKYVGAHGMDGHNFGPFEEIYNVPLIMSGPGIQQGAVTSARVGLHDLCPTICELGEAEQICVPDSQSLAGVLNNPIASDDFQMGYAENHGNRFTCTQRILWDGFWKLAFNGFDFDELYHLEEDPHEMHNRINDPDCSERIRAMMAKIWERIRATDDQALFFTNYYTMRIGVVGPNL